MNGLYYNFIRRREKLSDQIGIDKSGRGSNLVILLEYKLKDKISFRTHTC